DPVAQHGTVVADNKLRIVTYTPAPGFRGIDNFMYTVRGSDGGTGTATVTVIVSTPTATVLTSSPNPSDSGQPMTLTATVAVTAPGTGTPAGPVSFVYVPTGMTLGTAMLDARGIA